MSRETAALIEARVRAALTVLRLELVDESHRHVGHAGAGGGGHYHLTVVSPDFAGRGRLERHRLIQDLVADALRAGAIHALAIKALAPDEDAPSSPQPSKEER